MSTEHIVSLLIAERDRIQAAITALHGTPEPEPNTVPDWVLPKTAPAPKKRTISAASRRRMAEGQRKRWAAINAAKAETVVPKKKTAKAIIAEVIAPPEDAEFKSRMSAAMKVAWAKRKKTAAKKAARKE